MSVAALLRPFQVMNGADGKPLNGGTVELTEPDTSTKITSYQDSSFVTPNVNPVVLDASGRAEIWVNRDCDVTVKDRAGNLVYQQLRANPDDLTSTEDSGLIVNGSFEDDTDANGIPDGWTQTDNTGSSNALDTAESTAGAQSMRFTGTGGNGGGDIDTTAFFPVNDVDNLRVDFDIKASIATVRNIVRVKWFDVSQVAISNTDVYDSTANPLVFTSQNLTATPPANARFAKLQIFGVESSGANGSAWFDRVRVFYPQVVSGVFDNLTIQNNEIVSTNTNGFVDLNPNGTGIARMKYSGNPVLLSRAEGISVQDSSGDQPRIYGLTDAGVTQFQLGFDGTGVFLLSQVHGNTVSAKGEDTGGVSRTGWLFDPDGQLQQFYAGTIAARTREYGFDILNPSSGDPTLRFFTTGGVQRTQLQATGTTLVLSSNVHGGTVGASGEDAVGTLLPIWLGDPDGALTLHYNGVAAIRTSSFGADVLPNTGDAPQLNLYDADLVSVHATVRSLAGATGEMQVWNRKHAGNLKLLVEDAGGVAKTGIVLDAANEGTPLLYYSNDWKARPHTTGFLIKGTASGEVAQNHQLLFRDSADALTVAALGYLGTQNLYLRNQNGEGNNVIIDGKAPGGAIETMALFDAGAGVFLYFDNGVAMDTTASGLRVRHPTTTTPNLDLAANTGAQLARWAVSGANSVLINFGHGGTLSLQGENAAGALRNMLVANPDGGVSLYWDAVAAAETTINGFQVNNGLLDVAPGDASPAQLRARNSEGGLELRADNALLVMYTTDASGAVIDQVLQAAQNSSLTLYWNGTASFRTADRTASDIAVGAEVTDANGNWQPVGLNIMPTSFFTTSGSLANSNASYSLIHNSASAHSLTLNNDATIPIGAVWQIQNGNTSAGGVITFTQGTGVTLTWLDGTGVQSGNRSLAGGGVATVIKLSDTHYQIWGSGLS